jgi:dihydrolipoamide dehydrogenase
LGPGKVVSVDGGTQLQGRHVILASGSVPRTIPGFEVDGRFVLTSDEVLSLDSLPARAVVIGGGAIGCEFASMMSDLGTEVTVLEALPKLLPGCDVDPAALERPGDDGHHVGGDDITTDAVVVSVGRRPLSENLGLEGTGVVVDERGFVQVDERMRTGEDGVYAVGDLVDTPQLAHVGFAEAMVAVRDILGEDPLPVDYSRVPWGIYCHPEVAFAGMSEQAAKDAGLDVVTAKHRFAGNGRALIIGEAEGLVKVIAEKGADGKAGRILGVHMVGPWVTEQLAAGYLAVNWEAVPEEVAHFIQPHPTLTETFGETVMSLTGRGLHG